jgi:hypothetical protein
MNTIRTFFVSAKHWQLFLIIFGEFALAGILSIGPLSSDHEGLVGFWLPAITLSVAMSIYAILWIWSYGSFLSSVTPEAIRLKLWFFRIAVISPFLYLPVSNIEPVSIWNWFLPFDLFCLFCALYAAFFVARSLILAETGKHGTFTDCLLTFLLLWLWPIGIWFFQPRINRLFVANCVPDVAPFPR